MKFQVTIYWNSLFHNAYFHIIYNEEGFVSP